MFKSISLKIPFSKDAICLTETDKIFGKGFLQKYKQILFKHTERCSAVAEGSS